MKFPNKISYIPICLLFLFLFTSSAIAAGPWTGRVVDFETEEPLEGVVVHAVWEKEVYAIFATAEKFVRAYETKTDNKGYFEIPPYINIKIPILSRGYGPDIIFFKPGYLVGHGGSYHFLHDSKAPQRVIMPIGGLQNYKYKQAANYLALPKLNTIEERKENLRHAIRIGIEDRYMIKLIKAINVEEIELGMEPSHTGRLRHEKNSKRTETVTGPPPIIRENTIHGPQTYVPGYGLVPVIQTGDKTGYLLNGKFIELDKPKK